MRPPTKGRVLKERVWCFVEALLTGAEDSFDFEVHWEDEDTDRPKFVVKTRRRFLEVLTQLKQSHIYEVINSLKGLELLEDRRFKQKRGSDQWCFALKLWSRDAQRNREHFERVWEGSRTDKSKALEATDKNSAVSAEAPQDEIDWRDICRNRLEKQKQLTTNRLMHAKQMLFDINQICVDLALVERKQPDKRSGDDNPAQSQSYKPDYEETQKLEYEEFIATVLKASPSNKIAIIGEPGAGKTTLLQRIAFWILDKTDSVPIWIRLGNLPSPAPKLKDYLLNNWLEDAILSVTPKIRAEFEGLLTAGRVWLLLDGVDEMVANSGNALSFIDNWIPGWCQHLSVVLTCRLNVWEANPHALNKFQTYRTLEFSPEKVIEFIEACFQKSDPELGIQLQQALNQPGKERIKDLIRNPLRLTLLCSTWHLREGKLPDTKAELYQQFVEEVYRWKKDEFPTTPEQRQQLNAKLKELALAAIDKEENRFCLRHEFVEGILGDRDGSVFQLALNIGWLNRVGVDAKNPNPNQPVYAFFHPTFKVISVLVDLIHTSSDKFTTGTAASSLSQIDPGHPEAFAIPVYSGLYSSIFEDAVRSGQIKPHNPEWIAALVNQVKSNPKDEREKFDRLWAVQHLKASDTSTLEASAALIDLIHTNPDKDTLREAVRSLGRIGKSNPEAIDLLIELSCTSQNLAICWEAIQGLYYIDTNHEKVIWVLIELIRTSDQQIRIEAAQSLGQILQRYPLRSAVSALKNTLPNQINDKNDRHLYQKCYDVLLHSTQNMTYPAFYQAWYQQEEVEKTTTSNIQSLNQADLRQSLQSAIDNDSQLSQTIHLICIDGSQFIDPVRPAAEIYDQMLDQNGPECDPVPETMQALKLYWNSLKRESDKRPVLMFYASSNNPYSEAFLTDLSKFTGAICVVTSPPTPLLQGEGSKSGSGSPSSLQGEGVRGWGSLQFFAPSQAIADVVKWIREKVRSSIAILQQR